MPAVPIDRALVVPGLAVGTLVVLGNGTYVLSTREDLLSVVAVVVSMYPAATVGWAALLDGERAARSQVVGMVLAACALAMITLG
jgi:drug/metabolite transporter (DMT)-like permease